MASTLTAPQMAAGSSDKTMLTVLDGRLANVEGSLRALDTMFGGVADRILGHMPQAISNEKDQADPSGHLSALNRRIDRIEALLAELNSTALRLQTIG